MTTVNFKVVPADARTSDEGLYIHFVIDTEHFVAICLDGRAPDGPVAAVTLIDQFLQDRVDAIVRFRDAVLHHRISPDTRLTPQRRQRLIESLRAIDGRRAGATYQQIAEAVFGAAPVNAITWKSAPLRDTVMRRVAAGLMVPAGQAVLASTADRRQLGRLMGVVGFAVALGPALGPAFGGMLIDAASWRWLFLINVPVGFAALIGAARLVPSGETTPEARIDFRGLILISFGLPLLLYGAAEIGSSTISMLSIASAGIGIGLTALFVFHAVQSPDPLIDVALLLRSGFSAPVVTAGLTGAAMYGGLLLLPLFLQRSLGQTPTEAGLMLMAMGLGSAFILPVAGALTDRYGPRRISLGGGGLLILTTIPFVSPVPLAFAAVVILLVTRGAALALAQMPAITAAYNAVDEAETGDAATLINIGQRLGGALGAIAMVAVIEQFGDSASVKAYQIAFGALAVISVGAMLVATRVAVRR